MKTQLEIANELNQRGAVIEKLGETFLFKMWGTQSSGSHVLRTRSTHETFDSAVIAAKSHLDAIGE